MTAGSDHDGLLQSELKGVAKDFSYWHRLASEGLVYISTNPADTPYTRSRFDLVRTCETNAKAVAINDIQVELADGLLAAADRMQERLQCTHRAEDETHGTSRTEQ